METMLKTMLCRCFAELEQAFEKHFHYLDLQEQEECFQGLCLPMLDKPLHSFRDLLKKYRAHFTNERGTKNTSPAKVQKLNFPYHKAWTEITEMRNDFAHNRGVSTRELIAD